MTNNAKMYREISLKIVEAINKEKLDILDELFDKRQVMLDKESDIEQFKKNLIKDGILDIDKNIHKLLSENIDKVKCEIREHRVSKQANNSYISFNKEKINIFNEKV
ncbi:flagellar protein FliT [Romboutsia sedimentorum]|uniref:flagellar protein FliT n=1 Tax=Romboutsia sedimentorum TaxID=1368474 RepID=UPI0024DE9BC2|nr:flagellar protein FliT [Romboutsia sedimentorum]MDK2585818.1 flagellar protein FliT [Romboutsia sedimentorum]